MILHAALIAAFFVDQTQQTQCVVQCAQAAPESGLKSLLPTIVQTIVSLLSIFAGVGIAVRSFRANKKTEHEQWIRDQKKAEWKELLKKAAEIERVLPIVPMPRRDRLSKIVDRLKPAVNRLSVTRASCVFLQDFFKNDANINRFTSFIKDADAADTVIWAFTEVLKGSAELYVNEAISLKKAGEDLDEGDKRIKIKIDEISAKYFDFIEWLRCEAEKDLSIVTSDIISRQE
jgi:hypothetical protein